MFKIPTKFSVSASCLIPMFAVFGLLAFSAPVYAGPETTEYELELFDSPLPANPDFFGFRLPFTEFHDISDNGIVVWASFSINPENDHEIEAAGIYDVTNDEYITFFEKDWDAGTEDGFRPFGINNPGALVTGDFCQYVNKQGELVQLALPGYAYCSTRGISNKGVISGFARITGEFSGDWTSFTYDPRTETFETFLPDTDRSIAQGINSKGQVAGSHGPSADRNGFIYDSKDGSHRFFKVRVGEDSYPTQARGIADDGTIVGVFAKEEFGPPIGFVGRLSDDPDDHDLIPTAVFDPDEYAECDAGMFLTRINSSGVISGLCWDDDPVFADRGLLLTPVTED